MTELRRLRKERGLSREELGARAKVSWTTIRAHEIGTAKGFTSKTADAIASVLEVETRDLFFPRETDISVKTDKAERVA